jgi:hypothetical protein
MIIKSSRILSGWRSPTKFILPDRMELRNDSVKVIQREWFGLKREEETISIDRIASTRIQFGLLKATVILETYGGAKRDPWLSGVSKGKARAFREEIQERLARLNASPGDVAAAADQPGV